MENKAGWTKRAGVLDLEPSQPGKNGLVWAVSWHKKKTSSRRRKLAYFLTIAMMMSSSFLITHPSRPTRPVQGLFMPISFPFFIKMVVQMLLKIDSKLHNGWWHFLSLCFVKQMKNKQVMNKKERVFCKRIKKRYMGNDTTLYQLLTRGENQNQKGTTRNYHRGWMTQVTDSDNDRGANPNQPPFSPPFCVCKHHPGVHSYIRMYSRCPTGKWNSRLCCSCIQSEKEPRRALDSVQNDLLVLYVKGWWYNNGACRW